MKREEGRTKRLELRSKKEEGKIGCISEKLKFVWFSARYALSLQRETINDG